MHVKYRLLVITGIIIMFFYLSNRITVYGNLIGHEGKIVNNKAIKVYEEFQDFILEITGRADAIGYYSKVKNLVIAPDTLITMVKSIVKTSVKYSFVVTSHKDTKGDMIMKKMWEDYADTIENYYNAQNEYIKTGILPDKTYKTYNSLYFVTNDEQNKLSDQVFLVHDINSDGVPELFIGRYYHETKEYTIYDAYTWYEDKAVRFLKDNDIGYRSGTCDIKEGGIILSFHSGSAWDFGFYVLQLPKSGSTVETLEHVYALRAGEYYNEYSEFYKSTGDSKTPGKITESEYIKYRDSFKTPDLPYVETTQETITSLRHGKIEY